MLHHCMSYCLVHICAHRNLLVKSSIAWIRQWSKSELTLYYCIPMHFISWSTAIWGYVLWTYTADSARSSYFGGKDPSSNRSAINRRIVEYHSEWILSTLFELLSAMCFPGQANLSTVFAGALKSVLMTFPSTRTSIFSRQWFRPCTTSSAIVSPLCRREY